MHACTHNCVPVAGWDVEKLNALASLQRRKVKIKRRRRDEQKRHYLHLLRDSVKLSTEFMVLSICLVFFNSFDLKKQMMSFAHYRPYLVKVNISEDLTAK